MTALSENREEGGGRREEGGGPDRRTEVSKPGYSLQDMEIILIWEPSLLEAYLPTNGKFIMNLEVTP